MIDGKRTKLKDNSLFVCFAPRENPKIAIAVVVENAGFGSTWAAPIASLLMEKYLNDTLRTERLKEVDRIASANLMPAWLGRLQYQEDSIRAFKWFKITSDSSYIRKYLRRSAPAKKDSSNSAPKERIVFVPKYEATEPPTASLTKSKEQPYK
jgi:penicillin-binding protein 2